MVAAVPTDNLSDSERVLLETLKAVSKDMQCASVAWPWAKHGECGAPRLVINDIEASTALTGLVMQGLVSITVRNEELSVFVPG